MAEWLKFEKRTFDSTNWTVIGPCDGPPMGVSYPLTHKVYLLQFLSYLAGSKSVSLTPIRSGYEDNYRSRSYRFVGREKRLLTQNQDRKIHLFQAN